MGTFATTTGIQTVLLGITFDSLTTALVSKCITWSENEIRSCLSKRYDLSAAPFDTTTTIPPMVTAITEQLTTGYYFKNASRGAKESLSRGKALLDDARIQLKDICDGDVDLLDVNYAVITERTSHNLVLGSMSSFNTTFDEDDPLDWAPDPDKLDAISDERDS